MWNEIKAEIIQLIANKVFTKNLALVSLVAMRLRLRCAIAGMCSLADLQSKHLSAAEPTLRANVFYSSSGKIILKHR